MKSHPALGKAKKAIAFNPNFAEGHTERGFIVDHVGRSGEALKCFERAVALEPYFPDIWPQFRAQALRQLAISRGRRTIEVGNTRKIQSGKPPQKSVSNDFCSIETSV